MFSLLVTLAGCNQSNTNNIGETSPSPTVTSTSGKTSPSPTATSTPGEASPSPSKSPISAAPNNTGDASQLISPQGIGDLRLGMTYGELKQKLGSQATFEAKSPFIVDFDAIAVDQDSKTIYYILYPAGTAFSNSSKIAAVLTENPDYRTDKGIGPGSKIKDAEAAYGKASLSYNTANESREYVKFADYEPRNVYFRPSANAQPFAGVYTSPTQEFNKTNQFHNDAVIKSVQIICPPEACQ
jgi:hypothetical protein